MVKRIIFVVVMSLAVLVSGPAIGLTGSAGVAVADPPRCC
jgi:hypothetical protein